MSTRLDNETLEHRVRRIAREREERPARESGSAQDAATLRQRIERIARERDQNLRGRVTNVAARKTIEGLRPKETSAADEEIARQLVERRLAEVPSTIAAADAARMPIGEPSGDAAAQAALNTAGGTLLLGSLGGAPALAGRASRAVLPAAKKVAQNAPGFARDVALDYGLSKLQDIGVPIPYFTVLRRLFK